MIFFLKFSPRVTLNKLDKNFSNKTAYRKIGKESFFKNLDYDEKVVLTAMVLKETARKRRSWFKKIKNHLPQRSLPFQMKLLYLRRRKHFSNQIEYWPDSNRQVELRTSKPDPKFIKFLVVWQKELSNKDEYFSYLVSQRSSPFHYCFKRAQEVILEFVIWQLALFQIFDGKLS